MKIIEIEGGRFSNLKGFYDEIERGLTSGLDWKVGRNLDAFDDLLEGGFGMHDYGEEVELIWTNSDRSRMKLGYEETVKYFQDKLRKCHPSNKREVKNELEMAMNGKGETLFEMIVEIIKDHQHITLKMK
ncbi:MAG: barstar family protein [Lewinellaceae bacterium]|nr:barstar family protein [Lewinellaceae bacterium]